jgi:AmmeMemoRadiSam system protein B
VRQPVAAGGFYPARGDQLAETVERLLEAARPSTLPGEVRAVVAPHAGYAFSGRTAAAAFAALPSAGEAAYALLGPSHFAPLRGLAVSGADAWRTPLGTVPVDGGLRAAAVAAGAVVDDGPHARDHAVEVLLPFLQHRFGEGLQVLPVSVGGATPEAAAVVAALAAQARLVVSTDLSHYHDDATARRLDRRTAAAVVALDADAIGAGDACGADALRAVLAHARGAGWRCAELDLRTSADATGGRERVVGYGAFALTASARAGRGDASGPTRRAAPRTRPEARGRSPGTVRRR